LFITILYRDALLYSSLFILLIYSFQFADHVLFSHFDSLLFTLFIIFLIFLYVTEEYKYCILCYDHKVSHVFLFNDTLDLSLLVHYRLIKASTLSCLC